VRKGVDGYFYVPVKGVKRVEEFNSWVTYGKLIIDIEAMLAYLNRLSESAGKNKGML